MLLNKLNDWKPCLNGSDIWANYNHVLKHFTIIDDFAICWFSNKLIQRSNVDLPEPEEPIMVTTSPLLTFILISFNTSFSPKLFVNVQFQ